MNSKGQRRFRLPASYGGLIRYFEDYKSKIELKPDHVIFFTILLILVVLFLHFYG
ncbi:MAG: preprotein translocase subunit Sec61beta [Nanoarchaeota archaeon]|nr:preprotein translocase subunit Sec61beta [Nanoarchaeota archaeon]